MKLFYFECDMGCGIRAYKTLKAAEKEILAEVGWTNNPHRIREATEYDISHVKVMGGHVPEIKKEK